MHKQTIRQKTVLRFRQLSRKGYSAFYSLKKCVTIGRLDKALIETAQRKQPELCPALSVMEYVAPEKDHPDDDRLLPDLILWIEEMLSAANHTYSLSSLQSAGEEYSCILKTNPYNRGMCALTHIPRLFLCLNKIPIPCWMN